jgi:dipeptidyl aminopeptidase/acylaminoacyl peptidase
MAASGIESYLGVRSAYGPSFRADGRRLAYLNDVSGVAQAWVVDPVSGQAEALTRHDDKLAFVEYAPVGGDLIYGMDAGGDERVQYYWRRNGANDDVALTRRPNVIHLWGGWSPDGKRIAFAANARNPACFDVHVMDVGSRKERVLLETEGHHQPIAWSADGRLLLVIEFRGSLDMTLKLIDVETAAVVSIPQDRGARYQSARALPAGQKFLLSTDQGRDFLGLALLEPAIRSLRFLHAPNWDVEVVRPSPDGTRVATVTNVEGFGHIAIHDLRTGGVIDLPTPAPGIVPELTWTPAGDSIVYTLNGARHTPDLWRYDFATDATAPLTKSTTRDLTVEDFIAPELIRYETFDGRQIPAFLFLPQTPKPPGGHPVVLFVHGGPESQYLPNFRPELQFIMSHGYAVLATNVRGSSGYGRSYLALDDVRKRPDSVRDLKFAAAWVDAHPILDGKRLAVMGGSYGGFMVLAAITTYPEVWAAAVDFYGIANWHTMLRNTGAWRRKQRAMEYGDPVLDRDFLTEISPINHVDRIRCPLLVAQGLNDPRVPPSESEQIVDELKRRGLPVEYVTADDEGHGFVKLRNRIRIYGAVVDFLNRYM